MPELAHCSSSESPYEYVCRVQFMFLHPQSGSAVVTKLAIYGILSNQHAVLPDAEMQTPP